MEFWQQLLICVVGGFIGGGGGAYTILRTLVRSEAKEALKDVIDELKEADKALHGRINKNEDEFVTCKFCTMQHDNLSKTLESMDKKLDLVISKI